MTNLRHPLNLLLLAAVALVTLVGVVLIPADAILPVHFGLDGAANGTMPKLLALAQMPIATALIWLIFYAIARRGTANARPSTAVVLHYGLPALTAIFAAVQLIIVLLGLGIAVPYFHMA
jgi:hypothetical protein